MEIASAVEDLSESAASHARLAYLERRATWNAVSIFAGRIHDAHPLAPAFAGKG
jgi:hypothetical protein